MSNPILIDRKTFLLLSGLTRYQLRQAVECGLVHTFRVARKAMYFSADIGEIAAARTSEMNQNGPNHVETRRTGQQTLANVARCDVSGKS